MFVVEVWNYHKNLHAVLVLMVDVVNTTSFVLEKDMHCSFHVCKFSELHGILVSLLGSVQTLASEFSELHV